MCGFLFLNNSFSNAYNSIMKITMMTMHCAAATAAAVYEDGDDDDDDING